MISTLFLQIFSLVGSKLRKIDRAWFGIVSDLLINLAAGWFGAVLIAPNFIRLAFPANLLVLTSDLLLGILCLAFAFRFRKVGKYA